jgi:mRNA-degrading endonuclease toxin of MazEF toxin-antitoxin module
MTAYKRGDVVLVGFVFSDESGKKLRPALVISSSAYNRARKEVVVAAITSNVRRRLFGDHLIVDWKGAGLLFPSVATGILRTVARGMIDRKLGVIATADIDAVDNGLRQSLAL